MYRKGEKEQHKPLLADAHELDDHMYFKMISIEDVIAQTQAFYK